MVMCVLYIVYGPVFRTFRQIDARVNILYGSQGFFERKKVKRKCFWQRYQEYICTMYNIYNAMIKKFGYSNMFSNNPYTVLTLVGTFSF